ncbi:hypothetical protein LC092_15330 [Stappia stellulata]|uniref:hypothetical protein n=1 Tax=Stappia TaxID=152161 RepID=UPI001CD3F5DC|nr:hypothetical protein [Stappia stellulata]MCA1243820.1 hypothetical protein [Stappia stellulata]
MSYIPHIIDVFVIFVGTLTSIFIFRRQSENSRYQLRKTRETQVAVQFVKELSGALSAWWVAALKIEAGETVDPKEREMLAAVSIWLPLDMRNQAMRALNALNAKQGSRDEAKGCAKALREKIVDYVENTIHR